MAKITFRMFPGKIQLISLHSRYPRLKTRKKSCYCVVLAVALVVVLDQTCTRGTHKHNANTGTLLEPTGKNTTVIHLAGPIMSNFVPILSFLKRRQRNRDTPHPWDYSSFRNDYTHATGETET